MNYVSKSIAEWLHMKGYGNIVANDPDYDKSITEGRTDYVSYESAYAWLCTYVTPISLTFKTDDNGTFWRYYYEGCNLEETVQYTDVRDAMIGAINALRNGIRK